MILSIAFLILNIIAFICNFYDYRNDNNRISGVVAIFNLFVIVIVIASMLKIHY